MSTLFRVRTAITGGPGGSELSTQYFNAASGTEQQAADAVRAFWQALNNYIHSAYTLTVEPLVYSIDSTTGLATSTAGTTTSQVFGTDGNDPLPPATQGVVRAHTGLFIAGRELTGKLWVPGPTEAKNTTGIPTGAYLTAVDAAAATLASGANYEWVIWSRKHFQFFDVTSASTWNKWGVLRSRRD